MDKTIEQIAKDRKTQYEIYQKYSKAMFNICVRITNDMAEAEDALQEAFVKAFMNVHTYKGDATFGAWLKRIVINQALMYVRRKKEQIISMEDMYLDVANEEDEEKDNNYTMERVRNAIQLLPDGYRIVLSLYLLEGYSHDEIAEIMNISVSTSKSQYNRAKKKLRAILAQ
ncbi:RNA polymerase sigma factor [Sediminitomix flava]|uniref:RNA polymerase sigma-70 factor (ECF subfamily) n=1 Tax=Sediminitomix flava TaxID=379075 RepID=A0A315ZIC9_SEDFL|nr:sigma-70 family RNA polymerase sigma factor [Sediminitomix flava]PWJ44860.1 RNA polymerase sigma-70 factor (ECF subfamily) [Sediminitomix flava]